MDKINHNNFSDAESMVYQVLSFILLTQPFTHLLIQQKCEIYNHNSPQGQEGTKTTGVSTVGKERHTGDTTISLY